MGGITEEHNATRRVHPVVIAILAGHEPCPDDIRRHADESLDSVWRARSQRQLCREEETDLLRPMVLEVDLLSREQLIPTLFPALLQPVEVVPRI